MPLNLIVSHPQAYSVKSRSGDLIFAKTLRKIVDLKQPFLLKLQALNDI